MSEKKYCSDCDAPLNDEGGCSEKCNGGWPSLTNGGYDREKDADDE